MPFFDALMGALGTPDPYQELKDYSAAQSAKNAAALNAPAPPAGGAQPDPTTTLQPGQTPQALKTPQDMGSIIVDLTRREQANQLWNQSLGMGFAAVSQPRDREMVSKMFNVNQPDPMKLGETIMNVNSMQQGQDRTNAVLRMVNDQTLGPQIARAFGMDWNGLKAGVMADPGLVAKIADTWGTADERVRAGTQIQQGALGSGAGGGPISDIGKQIVAGVGGDANAAMNQAQAAWDAKNPGQPTPWQRNSVTDFQRYSKDQLDRQDAARDFLKNNHALGIDKTTEFQHLVESLKTDPGVVAIMKSPNAFKAAINWIKNNPDSTPAQLANAVPDFSSYQPEVKAALAKIQQLHSRDYSQAMHSIGQRFSTTEVQNVSRGMDRLLNLELGPDDYQDGLDQLIEETKTIRGNSHGAAQEFDTMDPDLRTYVNPTFLKGGRSNVQGSGSEGWADSVKMSPDEETAAKNLLQAGQNGKINPDTGKPWTRTDIEKMLRKEGKRPSGF